MITEEQAKQNIRELLEYIGDDPDREGLKATPDRILRMFKEMFRGYDPAQKSVTIQTAKVCWPPLTVCSGCSRRCSAATTPPKNR